MDEYTEMLYNEAATLSPDDDDYEERLLEVACSFRSFDEALTRFICENGFEGSADNTDEKLVFLKTKFKAAGVPVPREINEWFTDGKTIKRETAFQLCFAFGLNVEQTNEFFSKVYLERSFDCHSIREAVYYYCMRNGLSYGKAVELIGRLPEQTKSKVDTDKEVLYTGTIVEFINSVKDESELIEFIEQHIGQFGYNNVTAKEHIQHLWNEIYCYDGLAYKEGLILEKSFTYIRQEGNSDDDYLTVPQKRSSVWKLLAQILGLDRRQAEEFKTNRSIKPLLENNILLPPLAEASFPDRDGIEKIIRGQHVSHERIRKLLILLEFYTYWAKRIVERNDIGFIADKDAPARCVDQINSYLLEAGYSELYAGNPYDWIFLWAVNDADPLAAFREYMREIFAARNDQPDEKAFSDKSK